MKKIKTGLFIGSFNPIHVGHTIVAQHAVEAGDLDELWFVVSPHNPFKDPGTLADKDKRLAMAKITCSALGSKFKASNVEFGLPTPSYTYDTLKYLEEHNPEREFSVILGTDNAKDVEKWKNGKEIMKDYRFLLFPRMGYKPITSNELAKFTNVMLIQKCPNIEMSSTYVRQRIAEKKSIMFMVPQDVMGFIQLNGIYGE